MKKSYKLSFLSLLLFWSLIYYTACAQQSAGSWKAGTARVIITPQEPIWMAGYASRDHVSEGVLTELNAKALALEDSRGKKVVLITADLLGFPKNISDRIRNRISSKFGLDRSRIILSTSHTHTGPVLSDALIDMYPLDDNQTGVIKKYSDNLVEKLVDLTGQALKSMTPAQIFSQNGVTRFQVNRRNNTEKTINALTELKGPNDYSVPVLKVADESGNLKVVVFGYACHATVLSTYQLSGDYPGFAQIEIEKLHPGVTAMFFQGAGADQNPLPRRSVPLARQYGSELAAAVERVLSEGMNQLEPQLSAAYSEVNLTFATPPTMEELMKMEQELKGFEQRWATNQIAALKKEGYLRTSYPYPVEVWKLGDQAVMALGGELVVQYAIDLKKLFGPGIFVMGYTNDDMAYIPSETILKEGGYEGESSQRVYGLPAKWNSDIQVKIINEVEKLAAEAGVKTIDN
jgi:neutral ceramidase